VNFEEAKASADSFLKKHGFKDMKAISYDKYQNTGAFTYVGTQNGVLIYPDKLTLKVALDKGQTVGLQANDYVYQHHTRKIPSPTITKADARKALNPEMKVQTEQMAIIFNDLGKEALCYEYTGNMNGSIYRVYINAETGTEESIEEMSHADSKAASDK